METLSGINGHLAGQHCAAAVRVYVHTVCRLLKGEGKGITCWPVFGRRNLGRRSAHRSHNLTMPDSYDTTEVRKLGRVRLARAAGDAYIYLEVSFAIVVKYDENDQRCWPGEDKGTQAP